MNKFIIFLFINIFSFLAFAYDFSLSCKKLEPDPEIYRDDYGLKCSLLNKAGNQQIGHTEVFYRNDKKELHVDSININENYRERGLSSVLLYHAVKKAKDLFKDFEILSLIDSSSVTEETKIPHYERYGFKHIGFNIYEMDANEFLSNEKNKTRYKYHHPDDTIEIIEEIN